MENRPAPHSKPDCPYRPQVHPEGELRHLEEVRTVELVLSCPSGESGSPPLCRATRLWRGRRGLPRDIQGLLWWRQETHISLCMSSSSVTFSQS